MNAGLRPLAATHLLVAQKHVSYERSVAEAEDRSNGVAVMNAIVSRTTGGARKQPCAQRTARLWITPARITPEPWLLH
jgi:hypothetical protein